MENISAGDVNVVKEDVLRQQSLSWPARAEEVAIADQATYDRAAELIKAIAALKKEVVAHHKDPKEKTRAAWKAVVDAEKRMLEPLAKADLVIRGKLGRWLRDQEVIRRKEEARRLEEARKREEELRINTAIEAEKIGASAETTEEILSRQMPVTVEKTPESFTQAKGISSRKTWKWKVVDENKVPKEYWVLNEKAIGAAVKSLGGKTNIAGIEVYEDFGVSVRTK